MSTHTLAGASLDHSNKLFKAIIAGDLSSVQQHLRATHIDAPDEKKMTPLVTAGVYAQRKIADYLVEQGAGLEVESDMGAPVFWFAAMGWVELVELAMDRGISILSPAGEDIGTLGAAVRCEQANVVQAIVRRLQATGADDRGYLSKALIDARKAEMVDVLVALGAKPNATDKTGKTPLFTLAEVGAADACRQIIAHGASVNQRADGCTPIYHAAKRSNVFALLVLLDAGADEQQISSAGEDLETVLRRSGADARHAYASWRARRSMAVAVRKCPTLPRRL
jgi:ankyrin repeat protein